jgi:mxaJ protein
MAGKSPVTASDEQRAGLLALANSRDRGEADRARAVLLTLAGQPQMNSPPAHALAQRGIVENVRGYMVYGDYRDHEPLSEIVRAVATGEVDVAAV